MTRRVKSVPDRGSTTCKGAEAPHTGAPGNERVCADRGRAVDTHRGRWAGACGPQEEGGLYPKSQGKLVNILLVGIIEAD